MIRPDISLFSLRKNWDAALAGVVGVLLIYLYARHGGIGLSPDSIAYIGTARGLVHEGILRGIAHNPLTDFPMGYPFFLSLALWLTSVDLVVSGAFINMFLYFWLIYLSGGIINHISTRNKWVKIPFLFLIVFSPTLINVYTMLWSETLFLVLTLLFFIALHRYGASKSLLALVVMGLIAGFSCVVRYAGVTLVGAGGLLILLDPNLKIVRKIGHLALYGFLGILFLVANLYRNYLITGMLTGDREKSLTSLFENFEHYAYVVSNFFYLQQFPVAFVLLIGVLLLVFYIYSHVIHLYKVNRYYNYWNICATFFIVYTLFMVLSATFSRYETLNGRLLAPLYIPCLLPFTFVVTWLVSRVEAWKRWVVIGLLVVLFGGINYFQYRDNSDLYEMAKDGGIPGYSEDCWKNSPLLAYIKQHPQQFHPGSSIYSDGGVVIYLYTGLNAELVPHRESKSENQDFVENQQSEYWLVWFYGDADPELLSLYTLLKKFDLQQVAAFPEGIIYHHPAGR